jgi:hypothetical protein
MCIQRRSISYRFQNRKTCLCDKLQSHCPKRYEHFHGSKGNAEGTSSHGRKLFMLIFSRTTMKISESMKRFPYDRETVHGFHIEHVL